MKVYNDLNLPYEDLVFWDSGVKGTMPLLISSLHEIEYQGSRKTVVYLLYYEGGGKALPHSSGRIPLNMIEGSSKTAHEIEVSDCQVIGITPDIDAGDELLSGLTDFEIFKGATKKATIQTPTP